MNKQVLRILEIKFTLSKTPKIRQKVAAKFLK